MDTLSGPLTKALLLDNSSADYYQFITPTIGLPTVDGVHSVASLQGPGPTFIKIIPYAYGEPLVEFYLRVYGYERLGPDDGTALYLPRLLVELFCRTGYQSDITGTRLMPSEYFCDTVRVSNGSLGQGGAISPEDGSNGSAKLDLQGCPVFQFDFVNGEEGPAFPNALFAPA